MALVCIGGDVGTDRQELERLLAALGHETLPPHQFLAADAVLFEPDDQAGRILANRAERHNPEATLIELPLPRDELERLLAGLAAARRPG